MRTDRLSILAAPIVALAAIAAAGADSWPLERYDLEFAREYTQDCAERGNDRRVCACAVDLIVHERTGSAPPAVGAAPPGGAARVRPAATRYEGYVAMCTRSARALGLIGD